MNGPQPRPAPPPTLTVADWLRIADQLDLRADEIQAIDPISAESYRRQAREIRTQYRGDA